MTTVFRDGPAKDVRLELLRTPVFLRAVLDQATSEWDALDLLDDVPKRTETVFVYRLDGDVSRGIACGRGGCRSFFRAEYVLHESQPDQESVRDTAFWHRWTEQEYARLTAAKPQTPPDSESPQPKP